jgi:hypothetical protein
VPNVPFYSSDGTISTLRVYNDEELYQPSPFEAVLSRIVTYSWYRLEYLINDVDPPGRTLLGTELENVADVTQEFAVIDPGTQVPIGLARVLTLEDISLKDINGLRATMGVPLSIGTLEVRGFVLEQADDRVNAPEIPNVFFTDIFEDFFDPIEIAQLVATSTFTNGELGNNVFLYDTAFDANFTSDFWGTDAMLVIDTGHYFDRGVRLLPMVGASYFSLQEELTQVGVFSDLLGGGLDDPLVSMINSDSFNHIYGPTIGVRGELVHKWFAIGLEPKVTLGLDTYQNRVNTERLRSENDPRVTTYDKNTTFSPVGELGIFARVNLNENLSFHASYTWLWAARVTRAHENIFYNDNGPLNPPAIVVDTEIDDFITHGWSVGGEIHFGKK